MRRLKPPNVSNKYLIPLPAQWSEKKFLPCTHLWCNRKYEEEWRRLRRGTKGGGEDKMNVGGGDED